MATTAPLAIDKTIRLDVNGSHQQIRMQATRLGLPPLLIVQHGPGIPLLHEVPKFQRLLNLEADFLVSYWEQRGCGNAPRNDAQSASLRQQVDDLRTVLQVVHTETRQRVTILGISLGGTIALQAVGDELEHVKAVIAISPDLRTTSADAAAYSFLQEQGLRANGSRLSRRVTKLGQPPYLDAAAFQRRASLLADLGTIEYGKTFTALVRETLVRMVRTYGVAGTIMALRNMNVVQGRLLPEVLSLDLFAQPPRVAIPVHYVFGEQDVLTPPSVVSELPATVALASTVVRLPNAGHLVHFDQPSIVRSIVVNA